MSPSLVIILAGFLGFIAVAGVGFALTAEGDQARTLKRAQAIVGRGDLADTRTRRGQPAPDNRRRQLLKTLRAQERQQKRARLTLTSRMHQAGLGDNVRGFWIASALVGLVVLGVVLILRQSPWIALGLGSAAGLGLPRWVLGFLANRRIKSFTAAFPDAMDIVVRGIRSGLPVHDSLRVIGMEAPEPLAGEFRRLVENLGMGMSMDQCLDKMSERMPTAEVRFFAIVLAIQSKTGGNLAEALANLSVVIRARKLMREKVKAMSGEAVASAIIIGSLPPAVIGLISMISPGYMVPLFTDPRGHMLLLGGLTWMAIGVFVMRRMINFKI